MFEKNATTEPSVPEDTLSRLGSAFSNLFSGLNSKSNLVQQPIIPIMIDLSFLGALTDSKPEDSSSSQEESSSEQKSTDSDTGTSHENETEREPSAKPGEDSSKPSETREDSTSKNESNVTGKLNVTAQVKKSKVVIIREVIEVETNVLDAVPLEGDKLKASAKK